jgi:uncharacterized protein (DUF1501 family)
MIFSRREFLKSGVSVVALGGTVPAMLMNLAHARAAENDPATKDKILVVFELNGGNDGINTVIPIMDPNYAIARPTLAVPKANVLMLDEWAGLHPSLAPFHELYKGQELAVVQGVGYPNANRSHFKSMEIWHRGDPGGEFNTGWLGRWYEKYKMAENKSVVPIIHYSQSRPMMFKSGRAPALSVNAIDDFYPKNGKPESVAISTLYKDMKTGEMKPDEKPAMDEMGHGPDGTSALSPDEVIVATGQDIVKGTELIKKILQTPRTPKATYPAGRVGQGMAVFAQMIVENCGTKLFYISLGGFDTHAKQAGGHDNLMASYSGAIAAFLADLKAEKRDKDVMVMCFSEFGRRVKENGNAGTDHGAASIMFFAGGGVKGGMFGEYPKLDKLDDGDLIYNVDFRDCYATVLEKFLGTDSARILPKGRKTLGFR